MLPAAITIGVFFGAMSCATGLAAGQGHGTHMTVVGTGADHANAGHDRHAAPTVADGAESSGRSDGESGSSGGQAHPGMGCVTSVQLSVPDMVVPSDVRLAGTHLTTAPPECVIGPEPPVPRYS